ncbi:hypothetical protein FXO38_36663 [Capsicum annuum]|nr:hypothetical protein FXO38_36663 [Capsicum annuum]
MVSPAVATVVEVKRIALAHSKSLSTLSNIPKYGCLKSATCSSGPMPDQNYKHQRSRETIKLNDAEVTTSSNQIQQQEAVGKWNELINNISGSTDNPSTGSNRKSWEDIMEEEKNEIQDPEEIRHSKEKQTGNTHLKHVEKNQKLQAAIRTKPQVLQNHEHVHEEVQDCKMFQVVQKLRKLKQALRKINSHNCKNIVEKANEARQILREGQDKLEVDLSNISLQQAKRLKYLTLKKSSYLADVYLQQRSKVNWIKLGDDNTS